MDLGLAGRAALVTGSSRGIGRATAELLAREGAAVAVTFRHNRDAAECLASSIIRAGGRSCAVLYDLCSPDVIQAAVARVLDTFGRIDILVNNAVVWPGGTSAAPARFERLPADRWQHLIHANTQGPFATVQAVLPSMREARWGRIVNVSSTAAEEGMRGFGWYAVSKASVHGLTRTLSKELSAEGILTNTVMPGPTLTERVRASTPAAVLDRWAAKTDMQRLASPDDVASTIVFLCSAANRAVTGEIVRIGGR